MYEEKKMKKKQNTKIRREKVNTQCYFTQSGTTPDYKDVLILRRFISERGKILPQKISGCTSKHQRKLTNEIKKARFMALLPYTEQHSM